MSALQRKDSPTCDGCGAAIEPSRGNRPRRWCSERCRRQTLYSGTCERCGAPTDGSNGRGPNAAKMCSPCRHEQEAAEATWTRDRCIAEGHRWRALTGRWPITGDWNRSMASGERRALIDRYHELAGPWPHPYAVTVRFGSWRSFIETLGGEAMRVRDGGRGRSKDFRTAELRTLVARAEQRLEACDEAEYPARLRSRHPSTEPPRPLPSDCSRNR